MPTWIHRAIHPQPSGSLIRSTPGFGGPGLWSWAGLIVGLGMACGGGSASTPAPPPPTCGAAPSVPSGLAASAITDTSVTLAWNAATAGSGCSVSYRVFREGVSSAVASPSTNKATITGLSPYTQYTFTVASADAAGASAQSAPITVMTTGTPPTQYTWMGQTWHVKAGTGMGPGPNVWNAGNVFLDGSGGLHLKITYDGSVWNCAEVYTAPTALGFGTYQWQVEGRVDSLDPNVVLGLFSYGPTVGVGTDKTNEIDVEFARWGSAANNIGNWTVYPYSGSTIKSTDFPLTLSGAKSTSRYAWNSTSVAYRMLKGFQAINSTADTIGTWTYAPSTPSVNIPQEPMAVHMNLWLFKGQAPTDSSEVEVVLRDFQFVPLE